MWGGPLDADISFLFHGTWDTKDEILFAETIQCCSAPAK